MSNPFLKMIRTLWAYSPSKKKLIIIITFSVVANGIFLFEPLIIARLFNSIQEGVDGAVVLKDVFFTMMLLFAMELVFWIFHGTSRLMERENAFFVKNRYRKKLFTKALKIPFFWHKQNHSGDTIDKINKAVENLGYFAGSLFMFVRNAVALLGSFVFLLTFNWKISIIVIFFSILIYLIVSNLDEKIAKGYKKIYKSENYLSSGIYDYIGNIVTVLTLRLEKKAIKEIEKRSVKPHYDILKNNRTDEFKWFLTSMIVSLMTIGAVFLVAYSSYKETGVVLVGTLFAVYQYLSKIGSSFFNFAWIYGQIIEQNSAIEAGDVIIDDYEKLKSKNKTALMPREWKTVQVKNLYFSYETEKLENKDDDNFCNIIDASFSFKKGDRIAFIGDSGSGKSTTLSLIRGLHNPGAVKVFIDGKKTLEGLNSLSDSVLLIPQDPEIFNTTVEENLTMGGEFSSRKIKKALELSRFNEVMPRLAEGIKTKVLEKGVSLSGGEKQRLALARGVLMISKFEIVLLDEPTSSVDSKNELQIYLQIFSNFKDKTIISSIHRLHLLKYFDYIYYFKDGKIKTQGTFNTLLSDPIFKKLWDNYSKKND